MQLPIETGARSKINQILKEEQNRIEQARENYRQVLIQTIQKGYYPFTEEIKRELKTLQENLGLTDLEADNISSSVLLRYAGPDKGLLAQSEFRSSTVREQPQAFQKAPEPSVPTRHRLAQLFVGSSIACLILAGGFYGYRHWQGNQPEQSILQQAIELAKREEWGDAISVLGKIPASSTVATQSQDYLEEWSKRLRDRAEDYHAIGKIDEALRDAQSIPRNSTIYNQAQTAIKALIEDRQTLDKIDRDLKGLDIDSAKNSLNDLQNLKLQKQEKSLIDAKAKEKEQSDKLLATQRQSDSQALLDSKKHRDNGELDEALRDAQSIPQSSPLYKEARAEYKALIKDIATLDKIDDALNVWDIDSPITLLKDLKNPKLQEDVEHRLDETKNKIQKAQRLKQKAEDNSQLNQPSPSEDPLPNGQGYKYAWLSEREVTDADLKGKTVDELLIMRNSIYARHGFIFKSDEIRAVFNKEPWYKAISPEVGNMLSSLEKENVKKIQAREGK